MRERNHFNASSNYFIDIFTKYYKVKYHSKSPYYTRAADRLDKVHGKHLLLSLVLEIYTDRSI